MEVLKKERKHVKCAITRIQTWFENNVSKEQSVHAFIVRLESLNEAFSKYNELQNKIEDLDEDMLEVENRLDIEDKCFNLLAQIRSHIEVIKCSCWCCSKSRFGCITRETVPTFP